MSNIKRNRLKPPPVGLMALVGNPNPESFRKVGNEIFHLLTGFGELRPDDRILEIGCGCGKIATHLLDHVKAPGAYVGLDVNSRAIEYCRKNLAPLNSRFSFLGTRVRNILYNPNGAVEARSERLPFAEGRFTYILMIAVLSHMPSDDVRHYLKEIRRLLAPNGRAFLTMHLLQDRMESTKAKMIRERFLFKGRGFVTSSRAFVYEETAVRDMIADSGLKLASPIMSPSWKRGDPNPPQEYFVVGLA